MVGGGWGARGKWGSGGRGNRLTLCYSPVSVSDMFQTFYIMITTNPYSLMRSRELRLVARAVMVARFKLQLVSNAAVTGSCTRSTTPLHLDQDVLNRTPGNACCMPIVHQDRI